MRRSIRNFNISPQATPQHLNFWKLSRSNSYSASPWAKIAFECSIQAQFFTERFFVILATSQTYITSVIFWYSRQLLTFFKGKAFNIFLEQKGAVTALAFIGRFMASGSFSNIYLFSTELYPTILR